MEKHTDIIEEPVLKTGLTGLARSRRLATFFACTGCEHCEEL